jgi:hypothetical protein
MQLHLHILSDRGNRVGAFRLVSILREKMPLLPVEIYVPDSWARQEYSRWAERHSDSVSPFIADPQENFLKALNLKDVNYKSISEQAYVDVMKNAQVEAGWRKIGIDDESGVQITYRKEIQKDIVRFFFL